MTVDVQTDLFSHSTTTSRVSSFLVFPDGGVRLRIKNASHINVDEYSYADRVSAARFLLKGLEWGPNFRVEDFVNGSGGPNESRDRLACVESFGPWKDSPAADDLRTWINHDDSSRLDGEWDERIKAYYEERGY